MALSENEGWNGGFVRDGGGRLVVSDANTINVKNFGATGDGVTDDTQAIQDAIDSISGGSYRGDVLVPRGKYLITDRIEIPYNVNLVGQGGSSGFGANTAGTRFIAGHADAQLCFGQPDDDFATVGGFSGHFSMDGDGVSDRNDGFMLVHRVVGRMFADISVYDCEGDGVHFHMGQNCTMIGMDIQSITGTGLTLDQGVGGHKFIRCEVASCGRHLALLQTTDAGDNPYYTRNTSNNFDHCIFEYGKPYGAGTPTAVVRAESCDNILFDSCQFSLSGSDEVAAGDAMIQVHPTVPDYAVVNFDGCLITSNTTGETLIRQETGGQIHLHGTTSLNTTGTGWVYNGGTGTRNGRIMWGGSVTTRISGSGILFDNNVPSCMPGALRVEADTTKDGVLGRFMRSSETYPRLTISIGGGLQIGNGSSNPDVSIERITVNTIGPGSDDIFQIRGPLDIDSTTIGFFGATPASKPTVTGAKGGNAALASLLTALATLGLITDSSS